MQIIDKLLGNEGIELSYTNIYEGIKQVLGKKISHSDFSSHIRNVEKDGLLRRNDPSGGRRGVKVLFSLSEYAKQKDALWILKIDNERERKKRLLRLFLCFHVYRRFPLLTARQLPRFLKSIGGYSKNDLKEISPKIPDNSSMPIDMFGNRATVYDLINGIQIIGTVVEKAKRRHKETFYYPVIQGFSVEEFLLYAEDLRNSNEPRPFSDKIPFIPYIHQDTYSESEVNDAIRSLLGDQIITRIRPIFREENRFDIVSQELKDLAYVIWSIYQIDIHSLLGKILFIGKPSEEDKEYLNSHFGRFGTEKVLLVEAHDHRRDMKKQGDKIYKETKNFFSKGLPESRVKLVEELLEKYKNMIGSKKIPTPHRVIHELLYDILYPTPVYRI